MRCSNTRWRVCRRPSKRVSKVLFDQGVPVPLRQLLPGFEIKTAYEMGRAQLSNGKLLSAAEAAGFSVFITTDKNLGYQQNLASRVMTIVVLPTTRWPIVRTNAPSVLQALGSAKPSGYVELVW